ncbi:MAG: Ig-like domain-containing protein [Bellilinea sp.]
MKNKTCPALPILTGLWLALTLLFASVIPALAQDGYRVNVNKELGFANGSEIRGDFSISLIGDESNIASVTFLIDGQELAVVSQAPFKTTFKTQSYPNGEHQLNAAVTFMDGTTQTVEAKRFMFLSVEEERGSMTEILVPLLAVVFGLMVFGIGTQFLAGRGKPAGGPEPGTARSYGIAGGSICPRCKRPTPRHVFGFNLVVGKLDRCENCGKWSIMRAYPIDVLRAAEAAEFKVEQGDGLAPEKSEEEKLREMLDDSRYTKD